MELGLEVLLSIEGSSENIKFLQKSSSVEELADDEKEGDEIKMKIEVPLIGESSQEVTFLLCSTLKNLLMLRKREMIHS